MENKTIFELLKKHAGSHKAAAKFVGMSYSRFNEWRWQGCIPAHGRRLLELAVESINNKKDLG